MRKLLLAAGGLAVLGLVAVAVVLAFLRSAGPDYDRDVQLTGLSAPVEVWRDSLGVPHIWAESEPDLYFAVGYVHAQDRLWQMELVRRVAQGRLAEVIGEELVETDAFLRTIGLWHAAGEAERAISVDDRRLLEAYAAGVNAWIEDRSGALPPEFVALRFQPEPWTVRHSLAIEKIMAWDLAAYSDGLELARAVRVLGPDRARHLVPDAPEWGTTIQDGPLPPPVPDLAMELLGTLSVTRASNAWVIGGEHTVSGKPILANDMHLELRAPSLWYLMALHVDSVPAPTSGDPDGPVRDGAEPTDSPLHVTGMTLPGAPFVVAGHTRSIAWGFTNAYLDDVDLFVERIDPADTARYLTPEGSLPFEVVEETIQVRGSRDPVLVPVRRTRHGPILTPVEPRAGEELLAFRWAGHEPARTWRALQKLSRAAGWDDFVDAVADFQNPHQNIVYADTAGHFGYYMAGRVPIRGDGRRPPLLPVPGWSGEWDWDGYLPIEEHPHVLDPAEGYVVTANNRQAPDGVVDRIGNRWAEPFRAMRITQMIRAGGPFDAAAVQRQQLDVLDVMAARYRDRAVEAAERAGLDTATDHLRAWDLEAVPSSRGAALFYVWHERLRLAAARSLYGGGPHGWFPADALTPVLERRALPWVEAGGDAFEDLATRAILEADSIVDGRVWGELQQVRLEHALGEVDLLDRSLGLNLGPEPIGGSANTVNVAESERGAYPVHVRWGVSQRHVVDMGDIDGAGGFILPTGQSGLPFSPHYSDQFERWLDGGLWRIPLDRDRAAERTRHRMTLEPEHET